MSGKLYNTLKCFVLERKVLTVQSYAKDLLAHQSSDCIDNLSIIIGLFFQTFPASVLTIVPHNMWLQY